MLLERVLEKRATVLITNPRDPVLANWWGLSGMTEAGIGVTPETALQLTAVFACVRILTESLATLPLCIYRRLYPRGKEEATNHPLWKLFQDGPNEEQTGFDWLEMTVGHLALRGNAYNKLLYPAAGPLSGMMPLHPDLMRPFRDAKGVIFYEYQPNGGEKQVFSAEEILHFSIFSDGLKGRSVIDYNREAVGLGLAAEQYGSRLFQNGAVPGGVITTPAVLGDKARENIKKSIRERHEGSQNAHRTMILEEGMKWEKIGVAPDEAQFLETRKFQIAEIARMFRVPPHLIGDLERSTNNNIEQQSLDFVVNTLTPWTTRLAQRMQKDLLTDTGKKSFFIDFDFRSRLRGDTAGRAAIGNAMFATGAASPNDIRDLNGDNPREGGDTYYVPMNMVDSNAPPAPEPAPSADPAPLADPLKKFKKSARAMAPLFRQAWDKVITAEVRGLRRAADGATLEQFGKAAAKQLDDIKPLMRKHLTPVIESLRLAVGSKAKTEDFVEETVRQHISELAQELTEAGTLEGVRKLLDTLDMSGISDIIERETMRAVLWAAGGSI
jgi:HK97 family phage portal protein